MGEWTSSVQTLNTDEDHPTHVFVLVEPHCGENLKEKLGMA